MINKIIRIDEIDSTQEEARRKAKSYDEGTVILAVKQKSGSGKPGTIWYSPEGGLYFSIILKPKKDASNLLLLTHLVARVVVNILSYYGIESKIKLPNDVLVGSNKICGILVEKTREACIVGIGVNLNISKFPEELNATSVLMLTGQKIDANEFMNKFLLIFNEEYSKFLKNSV